MGHGVPRAPCHGDPAACHQYLCPNSAICFFSSARAAGSSLVKSAANSLGENKRTATFLRNSQLDFKNLPPALAISAGTHKASGRGSCSPARCPVVRLLGHRVSGRFASLGDARGPVPVSPLLCTNPGTIPPEDNYTYSFVHPRGLQDVCCSQVILTPAAVRAVISCTTVLALPIAYCLPEPPGVLKPHRAAAGGENCRTGTGSPQNPP